MLHKKSMTSICTARRNGNWKLGAHEEVSHRMKSASTSILILILVICGAVRSRSTENLVASAAAAAEPKLPDRATKVKGADEANRRLMALSEEDRRSVFLRILALAKEHCVKITRTFYQQPVKQWNVRCSGGPSYVIKVEAPDGGN
jgi:hypothetical protein